MGRSRASHMQRDDAYIPALTPPQRIVIESTPPLHLTQQWHPLIIGYQMPWARLGMIKYRYRPSCFP